MAPCRSRTGAATGFDVTCPGNPNRQTDQDSITANPAAILEFLRPLACPPRRSQNARKISLASLCSAMICVCTAALTGQGSSSAAAAELGGQRASTEPSRLAIRPARGMDPMAELDRSLVPAIRSRCR